jgi:hypothetical protein
MTVTPADIAYAKRERVRKCCLGRIIFSALAEFIGRPARFLSTAQAAFGDLGTYVKLEQAKHACERHYRAGCDLSKAERIIR